MLTFDGPKRKRNWLLPLVLLSLAGVGFLFCCSGLHFPFWNARERLEGRLQWDTGVGLPSGAKVVEAVWQAYRDPGEFYAVEMPVNQVAGFVDRVRKSGREVEDRDPTSNGGMMRTPDWWNTKALPSVQAIGVSAYRDASEFGRQAIGGMTIFYSTTSSRVYIFWYRT